MSSAESISGNSTQYLNTQTSSRLRRTSLPAPGTPGRVTPRGVFVGSGGVLGMSLDDLGLDHGIALNEKGVAPSGTITKTKKTWWGGKKTVTIQPGDGDIEAGPEPRRAVLLAPFYNGLAAGLSTCELTSFAPRNVSAFWRY